MVQSLNFGQFFFQQLLVIQVRIVAIQGEQFLVAARFYDAAIVQHSDAVSIAHGGNSMRNKDGGSSLHPFSEVGKNFIFGMSVDAGERVIENEDARVAD